MVWLIPFAATLIVIELTNNNNHEPNGAVNGRANYSPNWGLRYPSVGDVNGFMSSKYLL